jgi:hypothetical protein
MVVASSNNRRNGCARMPGKIANSTARPPFRAAQGTERRPHLAVGLAESSEKRKLAQPAMSVWRMEDQMPRSCITVAVAFGCIVFGSVLALAEQKTSYLFVQEGPMR